MGETVAAPFEKRPTGMSSIGEAMERKLRRVRGHFMVLGIVGALVVAAEDYAVAQTKSPILTVRPREMATATRTARAGEQTWDGNPQEPRECEGFPNCMHIATTPMVYVRQQCVGDRRCPLVVMSNVPKKFYYHIADKYGIITAVIRFDPYKPAAFDEGLQTILRSFAIDPDKIAILGRCATGLATVEYGGSNPNVFSLVVDGTPDYYEPPVKAPNQLLSEYFIAAGLLERGWTGFSDFAATARPWLPSDAHAPVSRAHAHL
jgi:hypothetical protein